MTVRLLCLLVLALVSAGAAAQPVGPPAPQVTAKPECEPSEEGEEIVVCGERYDENSPYRIPQEFRDLPSREDRHAAWGTRVRDEDSLSRFGDQTSGPFGYMQRSKQMNCEWLVARQLAQGRQPDCTRKARPNEADDWQRR